MRSATIVPMYALSAGAILALYVFDSANWIATTVALSWLVMSLWQHKVIGDIAEFAGDGQLMRVPRGAAALVVLRNGVAKLYMPDTDEKGMYPVTGIMLFAVAKRMQDDPEWGRELVEWASKDNDR